MPLTATSSHIDQPPELEIKRILVIDDDHELADTLKLLLEAHNYVVTVAYDGVEALRETMLMDFDVILCDLMMPHMPGNMFYLAVKTVKPHLASRFIFITGHSNDEHLSAFLQDVNGVVIRKPASSEDLIRMISLILTRRR